MPTTYVQEASCAHCLKNLGTHNIQIRVDLGTETGVRIGVDSLHFRPGLFDEVCPRNNGGHHEPAIVASIPQAFLDTVLPD